MGQPDSCEPLRLHTTLQCALAVASVFVFYTYFDSYLFALGGPKPWHWVLGFAAGAAIALVTDPHRPLTALRSPLLVWLLLYFAMTIASVPFMKGYEEVWQIVYDRCRSVVTIVSLMIIFDGHRARRWAIWAVAACIVLASALNVAEFLSLLRFTAGPERIAGRSSGLYFNPNESALAVTMGLAVVAEEVPRRLRMPLLLVSTLGVAAAFSRGAAICLALVLLWLVWRKAIGAWSLVPGLVCGAFLLSYAVEFAWSNYLLNDNTVARLHLANDDSGRIGLALKAWRMFLSSPWIGNGLGATEIWDEGVYPHNMFVSLAAEHGILGLLAFPAFGLAVVRGNRAAACFVFVLMAAGFFSHGLLTSRYVLLLVALAAANPASVPAPEHSSPLARDALAGG